MSAKKLDKLIRDPSVGRQLVSQISKLSSGKQAVKVTTGRGTVTLNATVLRRAGNTLVRDK
jgi:hypothetical protein